MSPVSSPSRTLGRPRDPELDQAILEATLELLAESGFSALSIEAVAARADVGKTTVYRRWPSKIPLVVDALTHLKRPTSRPIPDTMTTREALVVVLSEGIRGHGHESGDQILAGLVGAMSKDPELAAAVREGLLDERRSHIASVIERGVARGEVRPDVDRLLMIDVLSGPFVVRKLITGKPITARTVREAVTIVLDGAGIE